ncbi:coiled-coil domain-containing protein 174-like [Xenia sp. Carnegie-2017]|uniref:coiled-coil domain-containing protein 174-like n=1 Tax=Xenia sp. Carnegie-2017 TaxID=2897299 RepID=UPI001F046A02|nr:coiled-coil domain-containing protein 174-like [Xenia sp. Carnegie-2017]
MTSKKVISVNESSLVDLKAELYRKETQLKREKVKSTPAKKAPIWQKKTKELKKKNGKANEPVANDALSRELEKSRLKLEAKSALYDKLSTGEIEVPSDEDDEQGRFLVDFQQKTFAKSDNHDGKEESSDMPPAVTNAGEEWVEYTDAFGRSKMCMKKDLEAMKEKDKQVKLKSTEDSNKTLLSDDMRREIIRKKWEEEIEESLDQPIGPVHYQDLLFDEPRDHGVGYYQFSKVEEERQQQQAALNKLRTQTEEQRSKREKLLAQRKAATDARLAKIRARKQRLTHGENEKEEGKEKEKEKVESVDETDKKTIENDENEAVIDTMLARIRNDSTRLENAHLNEWEKGKVDLEMFNKPKRKTPIYDPRSERNPEFAPPSFYNDDKKNISMAKRTKKQNEKYQSDPTTIHKMTSFDHHNDDKLNFQTHKNNTDFDIPEAGTSISDANNHGNSDVINIQQQDLNKNSDTSFSAPIMNSIPGDTNPLMPPTLWNNYNTNVDPQNTHNNPFNTFQNTNFNAHGMNPHVFNTQFPNLPPPPIHIYPPPINLFNPTVPPPYPFPPQYPQNMPNYPQSTTNNTSYPNAPQ